jgi:hypothetical protein
MLATLLARAPGVGVGAVDAEEDARLVSVPEGVPLLRVHGAPSGLAGD